MIVNNHVVQFIPLLSSSSLDSLQFLLYIYPTNQRQKRIDSLNLFELNQKNSMMHRILAVDDDAMSHSLLRHALKEEGYDLKCVSNADAAIEQIMEPANHFSAFILDWEMPGMNGIELLKWIKEQTYVKHVPVIMLTGNAEPEKTKLGIDSGAYYYITKPFNQALLTGIIRNAVSEFAGYEALIKQLNETRNAFSNLEEGVFKIQRPEEAETLAVLVANACPNPEEAMIISELLNNAIEHGNLAITYDEKTSLIDQNLLKDEVEKRLKTEEYKNRFALVRFSKSNQHISICITDAGAGFDFQKYLQFDEQRVFDNHGRGIAMANSYLDIEYHGNGNEVEVRIPV